MTRPDLIVFSDLDGTLLDHDTYSFDAAKPMLIRLKHLGFPVVLASSKTAPEMVPIRQAMALGPVPMICENGAGLVDADVQTVRTGPEYVRLRSGLDAIDARLRAMFEGFGDMGAERIADVTGLTRQQADLAGQRSFSEPGLWHGSADQQDRFVDALRGQGIAARMGGRFLTLSFGATKADRMHNIAADYQNPPSVALGDAPNDLEMLNTADYGIIIANPHRPPLPEQPGEAQGRICRTTQAGPAGWTEGLTALLSKLNIED
ncbi:HAD-IIB family hydrolase [Phaeobacter marinintestinus]|uniref:HAD-IIB family hydrolase n=1 Tax=Falsiphaeobacter marinintestinus TaxID=1492905 RepID=UPI0011B4A2F4|nr:HAD-IIB family hydrolase [Phaeobacter marinintestinus]